MSTLIINLQQQSFYIWHIKMQAAVLTWWELRPERGSRIRNRFTLRQETKFAVISIDSKGMIVHVHEMHVGGVLLIRDKRDVMQGEISAKSKQAQVPFMIYPVFNLLRLKYHLCLVI
ncbi:hypothetical protein Plhal304r1_c005g0022481 [Plasmopara halstedii]